MTMEVAASVRGAYRMLKHRPETNGFDQCIHCGRGVHFVATDWLVPWAGPGDPRSPGFWRHDPIPRLRAIDDILRIYCSKCNKPGPWYEFKPGSGECAECMS